MRHASGRLTRIGDSPLPTLHPESEGRVTRISDDSFVADLLAAMRSNMDRTPDAFEDDPLTMPTVLYFSAYRDIPKVKDWDRGVMQPLVDELDIHLHSIWQHRVLAVFKQLAVEHPGMTIIASTHARELIPAFAHDIREEGLRKGGHIIEEGLT